MNLIQRAQKILCDPDHDVQFDPPEVFLTVQRALDNGERAIVLVTGPPGAGKTCSALTLLRVLRERGARARYATASSALVHTLRHHAARGSRQLQASFTFPKNLAQEVGQDGKPFDVVIIDDAQRLRPRSTTRWTSKAARRDSTQIQEVLDAARVIVCYLDEGGRMPGEVGTVETLLAAAARAGIAVTEAHLGHAYRHGGRAWADWVDRFLALGAPVPRASAAGLGAVAVDRLCDLEAQLLDGAREAPESAAQIARISAGACWPTESGVLVGDWHRPWANPTKRQYDGMPPQRVWTVRDGGYGQCGHFLAVSGLEVERHGVILGPDVVVRQGRLVVDRAANYSDIAQSLTADRAEQHIRRSYRTLLTRASEATVIYSVDPQTRAYLATALNGEES
jgi:hypothetical protein